MDKENIFINISDHPSSGWSAEQLDAAREYGRIVDIPFPIIDPMVDSEEVEKLADNYMEQIRELVKGLEYVEITVHLMGELNFTYALCRRLQKYGILVLASTTKREVTENPDGSRTSVFRFERFREYGSRYDTSRREEYDRVYRKYKDRYVTFVMPAYNAGKYISTAIESIQVQTMKNWKLIVMNDGSTDDTLKIAQAFAEKDPRITVKSMPAPSGTVLFPRKAAILTADTEFVSPLDADDWVESCYLEKLFVAMDKFDADIVFPSMWSSEGEHDRHPEYLNPENLNYFHMKSEGRNLICDTLDGWEIGCAGGLIRRDIYLKVFEKYDCDATHGYADEMLSRYLLLEAPVVSFSSGKYYYRVNPDSVTHKVSPKKFHYLINNRKLIDLCRREFSEESREYKFSHLQNFHNIFDALVQLRKSGLKGSGRKEVIDLIRESRQLVDRDAMKPYASRKYLMLLKMPLPVISFVLNIYGKLRKD